MTESPRSEAECCTVYLDAQPSQYIREVPIGNCLLKSDQSLIDGAQGPLAMSADGIHSPPDSTTETLIECKQTPSLTGIGQLLIYSYLRKRDRDLVCKWHADRDSGWETKGAVEAFRSHVFQCTENEPAATKTYQPKPQLDRIDKRLVVSNLDASAAPLLAGGHELGITVDYAEAGRWRTLPPDQFAPSTPECTVSCESWVTSKSRERLQSDAEESLAQEFCSLLSDAFGFSDIRPYREVPIGSQLSASLAGARRADLLVNADGTWFVVEIKRNSAARATRPFLKSVGQASTYAALFASEWNLQTNRVIPVVVQQPIPILGDCYRQDRYGLDYREMVRNATADMGQPLIIGPNATLESG
jgi:hypothetical protein